MRKVIVGLVVALTVILVAIVGLELVLWGYRLVKASRGNASVSIVEVDEEWGWRPTSGYVFQGNKPDARGQMKPVDITIDANGFRAFGDLESDRSKILIVGDSFTHALAVSNEQTYYAELGRVLSAEIFAYGANGYGTLQEIMVAEHYAPKIDPSILLLQLHFADFYNNSLELEYRSRRYNFGLRRPYLRLDGRIEYAVPRQLPGVRVFIVNHSRVLYFLSNQWDSFWARQSDPIQSEIEKQASQVESYRDAVTITGQLLRRLKEGVGRRTRVVVFATDDRAPYYDDLRRLTLENGLEFIDEVPRALRETRAAGIEIFSADGLHWGIEGHRIAGAAIGSYLGSMESESHEP